MSSSNIAIHTLESLTVAAEREANGAALVSATFEILAATEATRVEARVVRKTRTLLFMGAEATSTTGDRVAVASAVFKIRT